MLTHCLLNSGFVLLLFFDLVLSEVYPGRQFDLVEIDRERQEYEVQSFKHEKSRFGVVKAVFNRDETKVLTWGWDGRVRLWSRESGELLFEYLHEDLVYGAMFNSDESQIVTWCKDFRVRIFSVSKDAPIQVLQHNEVVLGAQFNSDESRLLTWGIDGIVRVWDPKLDKPLHVFQHEESVWGARFAINETCIVSWSLDRTARLWSIEENRLLHTFEHGSLRVAAGELTSRDSQLVTTTRDRAVLWNLESGEKLREFPQENLTDGFGSNGVSLNKDQSLLLTWGHSEIIRVWNVADPDSNWELSHESKVEGAQFLGDGTKVLTWCEDGAIQIWRLGDEEPIHEFKEERPEGVHVSNMGVVVSSNESMLLTWTNTRVIESIDSKSYTRFQASATLRAIDEEKPVRVYEQDGGIKDAVFDADDTHIMVWTNDEDGGAAFLWSAGR